MDYDTDVPFVSKRPGGLEPWREYGCSAEQYAFWSPHICAIACVRSLLLARGGSAPTLWELIEHARAVGVFLEYPDGRVRGAFHYPLLRMMAEYGLAGRVFGRLSVTSISDLTKDGAIILSIDLAKLGTGHSGSHLILLLGATPEFVVAHDNANILADPGNACRIDLETLQTISNGRGLLVPWQYLQTQSGPIMQC